MGFRLIVALAAFLALVALPSRSDACSCRYGVPVCETFWATPLVFSGKVLEIAPAQAKDKGRRTQGYGRFVTFSIAQTWKGEAGGTIQINTGMGGGDCGYNFVKGREYLVYAHGSGGKYSTGICSRTRRLSAAGEDLEYFKTALEAPAVGRIFGTATYQRASSEVPGRPVVGYTVTLQQGDRKWTTTTGSDGGYEFRDIAAGNYSVALVVPETERAFGSASSLVDPRGCAAADFTVVPQGRVRVPFASMAPG